jgi:hypothetical protein
MGERRLPRLMALSLFTSAQPVQESEARKEHQTVTVLRNQRYLNLTLRKYSCRIIP